MNERTMPELSPRDLGAKSHLDALLETVGQVSGLEVVDIGCGEGHLTRALAALGARVTGCDPSFPKPAGPRIKVAAIACSKPAPTRCRWPMPPPIWCCLCFRCTTFRLPSLMPRWPRPAAC